jgi:type II protein arginine methyltransferase
LRLSSTEIFISTVLSFRLGYVEEAAAYIRKSLLVNPNYLAARDNLENVCSHLVERWHFSMLNDKRRNIAFKFAIDKAIKSGYNTVLDIGTGTGILRYSLPLMFIYSTSNLIN